MQQKLQRARELLGIYRRPLIYLGIAAAVAALVWALWPRGPGLIEREIEREAERDRLDAQTSALEERAREAEAKSLRLEVENATLKSESDDLRGEIETLRNRRKGLATKYEAKLKEVDSVTDGALLRERNCAERERLGFPCPK